MGDHLVARVEDIPRDRGVLVEVAGRKIGLFCVGDEVYALHGVCPHQGGPVATGGLFPRLCGRVENERLKEWNDYDNMVVACPWHGWEFDLRTGVCLADPARGLISYDVKVEDGNVVVKLPGRRPAVEPRAGAADESGVVTERV